MNKDEIIIRKVKTEDARGWYDLGNKVWRIAYAHIFPEEVFVANEQKANERVKIFDTLMKNDNENISMVADYHGKVVGIMYGCIHSTYEYFNKEYADLVALYIDPDFQGCGIGTKLRNAFEEWAIKNGATKYVIGVLKDNTKARKVYEAWGGKLSEHESDFMRLDVGYPEVFYTYDLELKKDNYKGR